MGFTFAVRDKVPMYFLYGKQDSRAAGVTQHLTNALRKGGGREQKLKYTNLRGIEDTKLSGIDLIKPSLETEKLIETYALKVLEDRTAAGWAKRDVERTILVPVPLAQYLSRY
jgi:hypothetical protein